MALNRVKLECAVTFIKYLSSAASFMKYLPCQRIPETFIWNEITFATTNQLNLPKTVAQVFCCEFYEISKNTFFTEHLRTTASKCVRENAIRKKKETLILASHEEFVRIFKNENGVR